MVDKYTSCPIGGIPQQRVDNVSKFSEKLDLLISDAEDKVRDRDVSVRMREWSLSWLKASNAMEMLHSDATRTSFPEGLFLPEPLEADTKEEMEKWSKTTFPASKELSELIDAIATRFAIIASGDLEEDSDITPELIQRAQDVAIAYKSGQPASDTRFVPSDAKRGEQSNSNILRLLGRKVEIDIFYADGTTKKIGRNGNANNAFHSIREESVKRGIDHTSDVLPHLQEWNQLLIAAHSEQTSLDETFEDIHGNRYNLKF